jgi:hypothetical protein
MKLRSELHYYELRARRSLAGVLEVVVAPLRELAARLDVLNRCAACDARCTPAERVEVPGLGWRCADCAEDLSPILPLDQAPRPPAPPARMKGKLRPPRFTEGGTPS